MKHFQRFMKKFDDHARLIKSQLALKQRRDIGISCFFNVLFPLFQKFPFWGIKCWYSFMYCWWPTRVYVTEQIHTKHRRFWSSFRKVSRMQRDSKQVTTGREKQYKLGAIIVKCVDFYKVFVGDFCTWFAINVLK